MDRFLPPAPATILDVGGGAGAYAFALADKAYVVDLIDPVRLHSEQAKVRAKSEGPGPRSFNVGDARRSLLRTEWPMLCFCSDLFTTSRSFLIVLRRFVKHTVRCGQAAR